MVDGLYLLSAFLVFLTTQALLQHNSAFIHSHTKGRRLLYKEPTCSSGIHAHTCTNQWRRHREQFGVQYLAKGHFHM